MVAEVKTLSIRLIFHIESTIGFNVTFRIVVFITRV
jgi:hypothetical protein